MEPCGCQLKNQDLNIRTRDGTLELVGLDERSGNSRLNGSQLPHESCNLRVLLSVWGI